MEIRYFGIFVVRGLGYELLVLLEACGMLRVSGFSCVCGGAMSPIAPLSGVGIRVTFVRLRVWLYVFLVGSLGTLL
jgi:hypothetical protein